MSESAHIDKPAAGKSEEDGRATSRPDAGASAAAGIALGILRGFDKHFSLFQASTVTAKARFEAADWKAVQENSKARLHFYDKRVSEAIASLRTNYNVDHLDEPLWRRVKKEYINLLITHSQPELAETFYNSVFCQLFHRKYYNNDNIFVRSSLSTEYMDWEEKAYRSYYPNKTGLRRTIQSILLDFDLALPFENLKRDVRNIVHCMRTSIARPQRRAHLNFHINVLRSLFFRNKAAYVIGKAVNGNDEIPFIVVLLNNERGAVYVDALLLEECDLAAAFSFSRAYFMVEHRAPSSLVDFLLGSLPAKSKADLYSALGFHKQGKTTFYREFLHHLRHSEDRLVPAPGIKGMVMMVFTLPSYPYVFKVIRDRFEPPKEGTRATVKAKYQLVKEHDRVGRLADTLEYSDVALPRSRFSDEVLEELSSSCASAVECDGELVVLRHVYVERRMQPLNLALASVADADLDELVRDFGQAIKDMVGVNIFPGDMLYKNFGVTRNRRIVFYDYDEICYLTECNFRRIPPARDAVDELSAEPWYSVGPNDVFPESFASFFLANDRVREPFLRHHHDLLTLAFWQRAQAQIRAGIYQDVFPYPPSRQFRRAA